MESQNQNENWNQVLIAEQSVICLTFVFPPIFLSSSPLLSPVILLLSSSPLLSSVILLSFFPPLVTSSPFLLSFPPISFFLFLSSFFPYQPTCFHVLIFPQINHSVNLFEYKVHDDAFLPLSLFLFLCLILSFFVFKQPDSFSNSIFLIFRLSLSLVIFHFNLFICFLFSVSGS